MYEDKKYPIYRLDCKWIQDVTPPLEKRKDELDSNSPYYLPDLNRMRNRTFSLNLIYKKELSEVEIEEFKKNWAEHYFSSKKDAECPIINPSDIEVTLEFVEYETWCLTWFGHETFDEGQTDEEALESFGKFVHRKTVENHKNGHYDQFDYRDNGKPFYCLMGAEDRWRWRGADDKPPPCRCEGCKKAGKIRITH